MAPLLPGQPALVVLSDSGIKHRDLTLIVKSTIAHEAEFRLTVFRADVLQPERAAAEAVG